MKIKMKIKIWESERQIPGGRMPPSTSGKDARPYGEMREISRLFPPFPALSAFQGKMFFLEMECWSGGVLGWIEDDNEDEDDGEGDGTYGSDGNDLTIRSKMKIKIKIKTTTTAFFDFRRFPCIFCLADSSCS